MSKLTKRSGRSLSVLRQPVEIAAQSCNSAWHDATIEQVLPCHQPNYYSLLFWQRASSLTCQDRQQLYAVAQTIARGQRAGWFAALGIHIGGYVHVFAVTLGLAILFKAVPVLYVGLKFGGAA